jgi:hypothetical protein
MAVAAAAGGEREEDSFNWNPAAISRGRLAQSNDDFHWRCLGGGRPTARATMGAYKFHGTATVGTFGRDKVASPRSRLTRTSAPPPLRINPRLLSPGHWDIRTGSERLVLSPHPCDFRVDFTADPSMHFNLEHRVRGVVRGREGGEAIITPQSPP